MGHHNQPIPRPRDDWERGNQTQCVIDRLRAALLPGGASECQDSPPGTIARALAIWPTLSYGAKLQLIESVDRSCAAALYAEEVRSQAQPKVIEV